MSNDDISKSNRDPQQRPVERRPAGRVGSDGFWTPRGETRVPLTPQPSRGGWSPFDDFTRPPRKS